MRHTLPVPKLCRRHATAPPRLYRDLKRQTSKARRKLGKRLLDDAPRKDRHRGWSD